MGRVRLGVVGGKRGTRVPAEGGAGATNRVIVADTSVCPGVLGRRGRTFVVDWWGHVRLVRWS